MRITGSAILRGSVSKEIAIRSASGGTSTTNGFTIQRDSFVVREKAPRKFLSFAATYSESR
jgi:hypothetical protein